MSDQTAHARRIELLPLEALAGAVRNPKRHRGGDLSASMSRHGYVEPVVLDERTQRLVAGHGRVEALRAMRAAGLEPPPGVTQTEQGWTVPVLRGWASSSDAEAEAYLLASNRLTEAGGWDPEELRTVLADLDQAHAAEGLGFTTDELRTLLAPPELREEDEEEDGAGEEEELIDAPAEEIWVKPGELYQLGRHRLLCGDSSVPEEVDRLMRDERPDAAVTDPPYAIYGSSTGIGTDIADDKMVRPFFEQLARMLVARLPFFAHAYLFNDWRSWAALWEGCRRGGLKVKNCIVWDKGGGLGSMWSNAHELIGFFVKEPPPTSLASGKKAGQRTVMRPNVLRYSRSVGIERKHNAQKPLGLVTVLVEAAADAGQTVFDPYVGSGTTLVACEKVGRRCLAADIEPRWVQATIERWQALTGQKATRIGEASPS